MHKEWVSLLLILGLWAPVCAQNSLSSVRQSIQGGILVTASTLAGTKPDG